MVSIITTLKNLDNLDILKENLKTMTIPIYIGKPLEFEVIIISNHTFSMDYPNCYVFPEETPKLTPKKIARFSTLSACIFIEEGKVQNKNRILKDFKYLLKVRRSHWGSYSYTYVRNPELSCLSDYDFRTYNDVIYSAIWKILNKRWIWVKTHFLNLPKFPKKCYVSGRKLVFNRRLNRPSKNRDENLKKHNLEDFQELFRLRQEL